MHSFVAKLKKTYPKSSKDLNVEQLKMNFLREPNINHPTARLAELQSHAQNFAFQMFVSPPNNCLELQVRRTLRHSRSHLGQYLECPAYVKNNDRVCSKDDIGMLETAS